MHSVFVGARVPLMTTPRPAPRRRITKPFPLALLALPCTLAFFQPPPAALSTLGKPAAWHGSLSATWPATGGAGGRSAVTMAALGRRPRTVLSGKNRKKRKGTVVSQDSPSWFDDDEEDALMEDEGDADGGATASAAVGGSVAAAGEGPFSTTAVVAAAAVERGSSAARPPTATASFNGDESPDNTATNSNQQGGPISTPALVTDDALLPDLDDDDGDLDDDGNQIVLEPVWVEGETQGEKPIVETYGLNDALATAEDGIDIDNGMMIDPEDGDEALLAPADGVLMGGLADGVGPETWRNGMEVPDDDVVLGERFNMVGRGLDDMLMERSIRFYDPKVLLCKPRHRSTPFVLLSQLFVSRNAMSKGSRLSCSGYIVSICILLSLSRAAGGQREMDCRTHGLVWSIPPANYQLEKHQQWSKEH